MSGKPIAALVAGTSCRARKPRIAARRRLDPLVTQSTSATVSAVMVSVSGFGLAGSTQPLGGGGRGA